MHCTLCRSFLGWHFVRESIFRAACCPVAFCPYTILYRTMAAAVVGNYNYTVASLLHAAGRHRRHDHHLANCRCEDDHVIELRLVVAALNQLPRYTYSHDNWQTILVDFFNAKHRNHEFLDDGTHQQVSVRCSSISWFQP